MNVNIELNVVLITDLINTMCVCNVININTKLN